MSVNIPEATEVETIRPVSTRGDGFADGKYYTIDNSVAGLWRRVPNRPIPHTQLEEEGCDVDGTVRAATGDETDLKLRTFVRCLDFEVVVIAAGYIHDPREDEPTAVG